MYCAQTTDGQARPAYSVPTTLADLHQNEAPTQAESGIELAHRHGRTLLRRVYLRAVSRKRLEAQRTVRPPGAPSPHALQAVICRDHPLVDNIRVGPI